jgi:NAD(P)-dependent dehydrogenase (short-subunit alcohol dehydrogenase family)
MPQLAVLISGTAASSLGSLWVEEYSRRAKEAPVVAIDREHEPAIRDLKNVRTIDFDLNPLNQSPGYDQFVEQLHFSLRSAQEAVRFEGISTFVSGAGTYESGPLVETTIEGRRRLLGVNVCGNVELLVAVLTLNKRLGFDSSGGLSFFEIGSLRGLQASAGRSAYAATKAMGLDLCVSLQAGREVKRAIYVAPGPIDTHMFHRNYWVTKEGGSVEFLDHVRTKRAELYREIFIRCDDDAFAEAVSSSRLSRNSLAPVFERYKARRNQQIADPRGILDAIELAQRLVDMAADDVAYPAGAYVFTAPGGQMQTEKIEFADLIRRGE